MLGVLFLIIIFFGLNQAIFNFFEKRHAFFDKNKMNLLYLYHMVFYGIYTWYAYNNPSDSKNYFRELTEHTGAWLELFGTDTRFINFISYPFYSIGFNYDMLMATFAWLGYLGFVYAYLFFREKIPIKIKFLKIDLLTMILFFPNMHFWTASLGKGAPIFLGLMIFSYAIIEPKFRIFLLLLGSAIIFYIRPHVFMFVAVGAMLGFMSGKEKIAFWKKAMVFIGMFGALILVQDQILAVMGLQDSENLIEDFEAASSKNAEDLSTSAGSGVDMSSYPLPFKLFTFWFRPLFIDAPNFLGIITSFENLIYLLLFFKILKKDFIKFIKKSPSLVKMSLVIFLTASFAMTFVMSNLGIIMRQKSMVMYFIFFVIYYYLAEKKYKKIKRVKKLKKLRELQLQNQMSG
ncbi:hypothetical protein V5739_14530 [Salinimicrobium sp. TIG7-5_MAKvit]|uniref:hypothetical protein n=1 Tax=Salinimicrobium sp. TIG7-5_MAKvit TaxID=3121289 RepID=UPI003C6E9D1B